MRINEDGQQMSYRVVKDHDEESNYSSSVPPRKKAQSQKRLNMLTTLRNFKSFDAGMTALATGSQDYELTLKEPKTPSIFDHYDDTRSSRLVTQISTLQPNGFRTIVGVRSKSRLYD